jgi:hypothetical protein
MKKSSLEPLLSWLCLPRDWYTNPRLAEACDDLGPAAAAGWLILLCRTLNMGGRLQDRAELEKTIRSADVGLDRGVAIQVADAFIRNGLVLVDGDGYVISDMRRYIPSDNAIPPQARGLAEELRTVAPGSRPGVTEGAREGGTEVIEQGRREYPDHAGGTGVRFEERDGVEYAVVPDAPRPSATHCSHGQRYEYHAAGQSRTGTWYPEYWAAQHKVDGGAWCPDRPPARA